MHRAYHGRFLNLTCLLPFIGSQEPPAGSEVCKLLLNLSV
jgi:hypothetical protein